MATGTATIPERRWKAAFWASALASAAPALFTRHPPFADLPEHVASMATLARLASGEQLPYVIDASQSQYLLYHSMGAAITLVVGDAILASQLLVAGVALVWSVAFRALLRAMGRDERLALFAPMVFFNRPLLMGFLPFVASVPLGLLAVASAIRTAREGPTLRRIVWLAAVAVALFYTHASTYLLCVFIVAAWTCAWTATRSGVPERRAASKAIVFVNVALLPSVACALFWWSQGSLVRDPTFDAFGGPAVSRMTISDTLVALPIWTFDMWRSHVDEACAIGWWAGFAALLLIRRNASAQRRDGAHWLALVPFTCALVVYLATPFRIGAATMLNVRLAPVLTLFAILPLSLPRRRRTSLVLAGVVATTFISSADAAHEMRATSAEMVGDLDALLAQAKPGSRLVSLDFDRRSPRTQYWPYLFAGSYHLAYGGAVAAYSFAELPHWPVHYAPREAPPSKHHFWVFDPCVYRYESDGAYYDYVLVHGDEQAFADAGGPPFIPVAQSAKLTLYEKVAGPRSSRDGPCARSVTKTSSVTSPGRTVELGPRLVAELARP